MHVMTRRLTRTLSSLSIILGLVFVPVGGLGVFATTGDGILSQTTLFLDDETAEKGYTVSTFDDEFQVGVLPGSLNGASRVKLSLFSEDDYPSPDGWTRVTPVAESLLANADEFPETQPYLALRYEADVPSNNIQAAYYNRQDAEWKFLPSDTVPEERLVRARVPFRVTTLAGFAAEGGASATGPVKTTDVPAPGAPAHAVIVLDVASGAVLHEFNVHEALPLASLTKLVSARVAMDVGVDLDATTTYASSDDALGASVNFAPGDVVVNRDYLHASLVRSGNNAAKVVARSTGLSSGDFARRMTQQARDLGLSTPSFVDPTGLESENVSSAYDFALLARNAFRNPDIASAATKKSYAFSVQNTGRQVSFNNTNFWIGDNAFYVTGSKTGYLPETWGGIGFNLVVQARSSHDSHDDVLVLVLGAPNRTSSVHHVNALLDWTFENHAWE